MHEGEAAESTLDPLTLRLLLGRPMPRPCTNSAVTGVTERVVQPTRCINSTTCIPESDCHFGV